MTEIDSDTWTIRETAKRLQIGINKAYEAAKTGEIPTIRIGSRILVPKVALNKMLEDAANNTISPRNEG